MKIILNSRPTLLLSFACIASVAFAHPPQPTARTTLSEIKTPADVITLVHDEIRSEINEFHNNLHDLGQGEPAALMKAAFTGARLSGIDAGALTAVKLGYEFITRGPDAPQPTLGEILPDKLTQAPDRTARRLLKSTVRHGLSGNLSGVIAGDLRDQAIDLLPATLHSVRLFFTSPAKASVQTKEQS